MPVLLAETPRHSSVMIDDGRYVRPNYKLDLVEDWALQPPPYDAHAFDSMPLSLSLSSANDGNSNKLSTGDMPRQHSISHTASQHLAPTTITLTVPSFGPIGPIPLPSTVAGRNADSSRPASRSDMAVRRVDSTATPSDADAAAAAAALVMCQHAAELNLELKTFGAIGSHHPDSAVVTSTGLSSATSSSGSDSEDEQALRLRLHHGAHRRTSSARRDVLGLEVDDVLDDDDDDDDAQPHQIGRTRTQAQWKSGGVAARRAVTRSSPNLTMREMGKPSAVLGF